MSSPINEVALLLKTSVMRPLKQLILLLRVFSKPTAMCNNYMHKVRNTQAVHVLLEVSIHSIVNVL